MKKNYQFVYIFADFGIGSLLFLYITHWQLFLPLTMQCFIDIVLSACDWTNKFYVKIAEYTSHTGYKLN
jgi:hypothetical protein